MSAAPLRDEREMAVHPVVGIYAVALWWGLKGSELVRWVPVLPVEKRRPVFSTHEGVPNVNACTETHINRL